MGNITSMTCFLLQSSSENPRKNLLQLGDVIRPGRQKKNSTDTLHLAVDFRQWSSTDKVRFGQIGMNPRLWM